MSPNFRLASTAFLIYAGLTSEKSKVRLYFTRIPEELVTNRKFNCMHFVRN